MNSSVRILAAINVHIMFCKIYKTASMNGLQFESGHNNEYADGFVHHHHPELNSRFYTQDITSVLSIN